jgi:co-chaperonin GroES (HSP10)
MKISPLFSYVVLERKKLQEKTSILIPEGYEKRNAPNIGVVKACGEMCEDSVKALTGKEVLFKQHAGAWIETPDGEEYFSLEESDIIGVIE